MFDRKYLENMNAASVRKFASDIGIKNASKMQKEELINMIMQMVEAPADEEEWVDNIGYNVDEETGEIIEELIEPAEFDAEPSICPAPIISYEAEDAVAEFEAPTDKNVKREQQGQQRSKSSMKKQKKFEQMNGTGNSKQEDAGSYEGKFKKKESSANTENKKSNARITKETAAAVQENKQAKVQDEQENTSAKPSAKQDVEAPKQAVEQQALDFDDKKQESKQQCEEAKLSEEELDKARREAIQAQRNAANASVAKAKKEQEPTIEINAELDKKSALIIVVATVVLVHSIIALFEVAYEILWEGTTTIYWWYTIVMIGLLVGAIYVLKQQNASGQLIAMLNMIHNKIVRGLSKAGNSEGGEKK